MRSIAIIVALVGCGGPTQQQLVETPSARAPARHDEAPAASTSDEDRSHLNQQFDDMETTQRAHREAKSESKAAAKKKPTPLKGQGPAEQATLPPQKIGPAEQAPLPPPSPKP